MKTLVSIVTASLLLCSAGWAEEPVKAQIQNENQNRFKNMSTDELLGQRGHLHNQQEREQLHNELMNRQQTMTAEQKEKFGNVPGKTSQQMGSQGKGMGYGQGQGMMQGQGQNMQGMQKGKGMMQGSGGGMGGGMMKGKGGR
ncbi:MAG: hypothetical protein AB7U26_03735 [Sulfuricurvum sp.]